jgi:hypothetical protein
MSHAALPTILPVAGRDVERARAVEIIGIFLKKRSPTIITCPGK